MPLAIMASLEARQERSDSPVIFRPRMREAVRRKHNLMVELSRAAAEGEFVLHYQPQVRLSDCRVVGVEALLRWDHPQRGLLTPADFFMPLKQSNLASDVGDWVLSRVIADAANLADQVGPTRMAVNLFSKQFKTENLAERIKHFLSLSNLAPDLLELEITERVILNAHDMKLSEVLGSIRGIGCSLSYDDFGTGYASLSALKQYPIDRLKIDRSFVQNFANNAGDEGHRGGDP